MQGKRARACKDAKKSKKSKNFSAFRPAERLFLHNLPRPAQARPCNCSRADCKCPSAPAQPPARPNAPAPLPRPPHIAWIGFFKKKWESAFRSQLSFSSRLFLSKSAFKCGRFRLERKRAIEDAQDKARKKRPTPPANSFSFAAYPHFIYTPQADSMESGITPARGGQTAANNAFHPRKRLHKTPFPPFLH